MVYDNEVLGINISEYLQEDKKGVTYVSKKNLCTLKMKKMVLVMIQHLQLVRQDNLLK